MYKLKNLDLSECTSLTNLDLSECTSLTKLDLSECRSLTKLILKDEAQKNRINFHLGFSTEIEYKQ